MPPRITNIKSLFVNGALLSTKSGTFNHGGIKRIYETGPGGVIGQRDGEFTVPMIKCKIAHTDEIDLKALHAAESLVVTAELTNGKMISMIDPLMEESPEVGDDGMFDLSFIGTSTEVN